MILVVIVHADPSVRPQYEEALRARGIDAEVLCVVGKGTGLSSIYVQLAAQAKAAGAGMTLRGLLKLYVPKRPLGDYEHVMLVTFSAGYAFARALDAVDRAMLAGLVLLDSGHAAHDADGTAADAGVAWALPWASMARTGHKPFFIGHSDVDPVSYASTTEFAAEVVRLSGPELDELTVTGDEHGRGVRRKRQSGLLHVRAHDVSRVFGVDQMAEHRAALNGREKGGWGPAFVAEACAAIPDADTLTSLPARIADLAVDAALVVPRVLGGHVLATRPLGERLAEWLIVEAAKGIREIPGPQHHPAIQYYIAGARRGGDPIAGFLGNRTGLPTLGAKAPDETEWCASGRCAGLFAVLAEGDQPPHGYRAAVRELVEDARALGTWRDVTSDYVPQVGDAWIFPRAGEDPRRGGRGHVATQTEPFVGGRTFTIGGNEGNAWMRTPRRRVEAVGWIAIRRTS